MHKLRTVFVASGAVLLVGLFVAVSFGHFQKSRQPISLTSQDSDVDATYGANYDDPRVLVGYVQNVFAAKVLREAGNTPRSGLSFAQYDVEVLYNIKGTAPEQAVVDFPVFTGEKLTLGNTYLFATRHVETPWYVVGSHPASKTVISGDASLSNDQLLELVKESVRTYELLNAYPNEILRDIDVQKNRTANSFQSLSEEEKQAVYVKFQELIPPRPVPNILPPPPPPSKLVQENSWSRCGDGIDNDGDGLVDKADPDCSGVLREDLPSLCRDNIDDDRDGLVDSADPDCAAFYPPKASPPVSTTSTATGTGPSAVN